MQKSTPLMIAVLLITTTLAGCLGGAKEFDSSDLEQRIADLEQSNDETNQTVVQQALKDMNLTIIQQAQINADLLASILSIQGDIATSQSAITSIITELEQVNSTDDDLLAQLLHAQQSLTSLEGNLTNAMNNLTQSLNDITSPRNMSGANLRSDNLDGADLRYADLRDSDLRYVQLRGANLSFAVLWDADMESARLDGADLSGADLSGADLSFANLNGADLRHVVWFNTTCPDRTNSDDNGNSCANNL
jgi:uncharacterized protein YjbI with pentapeptide repeats